MKKPNIIHIYSGPTNDSEAARRIGVASQSRARAAERYLGWIDRDLSEVPMPRDAKSIGDTVALPFIHDMVDSALNIGPADDDIVFITNADIGLYKDIGDELANVCSQYGACYAYRWDFPRLDKPLETKEQIAAGKWYIGCDAFAFTKKWWLANKAQLPDFVLGRETWDWILRELIKETGGVELQQAIYHESHASAWKKGRLYQPGNVYNRSLARAWLAARNLPLKEIANAPFKQELYDSWKVSPPPFDFPVPEPAISEAPGMDVLIVLGRGSKWENNELRYCLRSLEKHAKNIGRVFVVGQDPGFLNPAQVTILKREDFGKNKEHNIAEQIVHASEKLPITEHFLWINDDCFFLADVNILDYPYYQDGDLQAKWERTKMNGYRVAMTQADAQLRARSLPTRNFELHVPIIYSRRGLANPAVRKLLDTSSKVPFGMTFRSIYCNVLGVKSGPTYKDMKLGNTETAEELKLKTADRHCFSIGDGLGEDAKKYFDILYPVKSKYEI